MFFSLGLINSNIIIKQKIIVFLFILLIPEIGLAKGMIEKKKKVHHRKELKTPAKHQINQLHDGALLVRLKTRKNTIAVLREIGKNKLADKIENQQANLNKKIIGAFRNNFNFSQTYFFFSDYSQDIIDKKFDNVKFLNDSLLPDTTIVFHHKTFLTAEFGTIEQDTATYYDRHYYVPVKNGMELHARYYGSPDFGIAALVIKSDQFIQLRKPFPFYVRTFGLMPWKRRPSNSVRIMNIKLHQFYLKN